MGSESRLKIVLDMINNSQGELKRLQQDLEGVKTSSSDAKNPLTALKDGVGAMQGEILAATGVLAGFGLTMKAAFDMGEQGAAFVQTRESFNGLMERVGASSEQLNLLRSGAKGTIDDLSLMRAETTLLAGAQGDLARSLAAASPQLMEIAKAANKLNPTLGDTGFMFESLALGVKRASPMILDNLGLTIKIEEANKKYAESLSKAVDQLSAEEQKQALLNDVLRAGNVLIQQAGGNTDSATDSFSRLNASLTNVSNSGKEKLMPFMANAAQGLELLVLWNTRVEDAMTKHHNEVTVGAKSYTDYVTEMKRSGAVANIVIGTEEELRAKLQARTIGTAEYNRALRIATEGEFNMSQAIKNTTNAATGSTLAFQAMTAANKQSAGAASEHVDATKILNSELALLQTAISAPLQSEFESFYDKQSKLAIKSNELTIELEKYKAATGQVIPPSKDLAEIQFDQGMASEQYKLAVMRLDEAQRKYGETISKHPEEEINLRDSLLSAKIALEQKLHALEKANVAMKDATGGGLADYSKKIKDIQTDLDATNKALDGNAAKHEEATRRIIFGMISQQLAQSAYKDQSATVLLEIAQQWGLIDEKTYLTGKNITDILGKGGQSADELVPKLMSVGQTVDTQMTAKYNELFGKMGTVTDYIKTSNIPAIERLHDRNFDAATSADGLTKSIAAIPKVTDVYINTFHRHYVENYSYSTSVPDTGKSTTDNGDTQIVEVQGRRDSGGPGEAGQAYLIGRGAQPEIFVPKSDGYFVPNADKLGGGVSNTTNIYLTANYANAQSEASLRDDVALLQMMAA